MSAGGAGGKRPHFTLRAAWLSDPVLAGGIAADQGPGEVARRLRAAPGERDAAGHELHRMAQGAPAAPRFLPEAALDRLEDLAPQRGDAGRGTVASVPADGIEIATRRCFSTPPCGPARATPPSLNRACRQRKA